MSQYEWVKLAHILSATVLFGTGLGIAFFMLRAFLRGSTETMLDTARTVVVADFFFTAPAVLIQLVSGLWLAGELGVALGSLWLVSVIGLFAFVGACWIPVVWIQIRIRDTLELGGDRRDCAKLMRVWSGLGVLALTGVLALFFLMVSKYAMDRMLWG